MIIAVDFDGTCVEHLFPEIGPDVPYAEEVLKQFVERGDQLILWTMRSEAYLDEAIAWFVNKEIPLFGIQCNPTQNGWTSSPKAYAHQYIDDAAVGCPLIQSPTGKTSRECVNWHLISDLMGL